MCRYCLIFDEETVGQKIVCFWFKEERMQEATEPKALEVGDAAPDVTFRQGRDRVALSELQGQQNVVVAFYAASFTGG